MFSQVSVCPWGVHGGGHACMAGVCMVGGMAGGVHDRGHVWWGHAWQGGCGWQGAVNGRGCMVVVACVACVAVVCVAGGHVWWGRSVCMAGETATAADATHATEMHSCFY